jgi:hypothetical protein
VTSTPGPEHQTGSAPAPLAPLRVSCPHCGQTIDVVPIVATPLHTGQPPAPEVNPQPASASPLLQLVHLARNALKQRGSPSGQQPATRPASPISPVVRRLTPIAAVLIALVSIALIWWSQIQPQPASPITPTPAVPATTATSAADHAATKAAIIETLTGYNRAETEAAALLQLDPIMPYLAADSPFAARRAAELAERRERNAPHRSILVRWGIGEITVDGDQATVVTQETWSNQEINAVAPEQATVRVTYTLRWDAVVGQWLIVESSQMGL